MAITKDLTLDAMPIFGEFLKLRRTRYAADAQYTEKLQRTSYAADAVQVKGIVHIQMLFSSLRVQRGDRISVVFLVILYIF